MRAYGILALLFLVALCHAEDKDLLKALKSEDIQERSVAAQKLLAERSSTITTLIEVIKEFIAYSDRKGTVKTAMDILGDLRAEESVPLLVQNLTLDVFYKDTKRTQGTQDLYPAVGALIKIGIPSITPVLEKALQSDDRIVWKTAAAVIQGVLGKDLAKARVEAEADRHSDAASRRRMDGLLALMNQQ